MTAQAAEEQLVKDGATIGLGGWTFYNTPMAVVHAIARARRRELHLVSSPGAIGPDLLIAAGTVTTLTTPFLTMEQFGLAPAFRRAAGDGTLEIREVDGPALAAGLRAAADDLPFGISLYDEHYASPIQTSSLPPVRRDSVSGHDLRSREDATSLIEDIEHSKGYPPTPVTEKTTGGSKSR